MPDREKHSTPEVTGKVDVRRIEVDEIMVRLSDSGWASVHPRMDSEEPSGPFYRQGGGRGRVGILEYFESFDLWQSQTEIECSREFYSTVIDQQWMAFWDRIWVPFVQPALKDLAGRAS